MVETARTLETKAPGLVSATRESLGAPPVLGLSRCWLATPTCQRHVRALHINTTGFSELPFLIRLAPSAIAASPTNNPITASVARATVRFDARTLDAARRPVACRMASTLRIPCE